MFHRWPLHTLLSVIRNPKPTTNIARTLDGLNLKVLHLLQLAFADPIPEKEELRWQETFREVKISPETLLPPNSP